MDQSLIKDKLFLAPMAGVADSVLRQIAKRMGADVVYTEMISAEGLRRGHRNTKRLMKHEPIEKPMIYQIFGADPEALAESAAIVQDQGAMGVDINMGCPVRKVMRNGAGSALMRDPGLVGRIVGACRKAVSIPLSVKIRLGINFVDKNYLDVARAAEGEGADFIALHARTQVQGYSGKADWTMITKLKQAMTIPVIGNGDVVTWDDYRRMREETGCDAVMIGRGFNSNPFIFRDIKRHMFGVEVDTYKRLLDVVVDHATMMLDEYGDMKGSGMFRKHLAWYSSGQKGAAAFRRKINNLRDRELLMKEIQEFFG